MINLLLCLMLLVSVDEQPPDSCKIYKLPPLIVTAKRWKWVLDTRPVSGEIIDIREVERISNLGGIIKTMVNADVVCYGGEGSSQILSLRGASPEQTLFLIDGCQINTAQGGSADLSLWPLSWIDRIEIYRAGGSVEMGAQAIGGIVNIITKEEKKAHKYVSLKVGSQSLFDVNAFLSSSFFSERFHFWTGLHRKQGKGDFWYIDENRDTVWKRENADFEHTSGMAKLGYNFGSNKLELNLRAQSSGRGSPGFSEFPTPDARLDDQIYTIQGKFVCNKDSFLQSESKAYTNWLNRIYYNPHPIIYADDMHKNFALGIEEKCRLLWSPNLKTLFGIELRKDNLVSTMDGKRTRKKMGTFLQNEILVGNKTNVYTLLLPGIRIEWVDKFQPEICPGLGTVHTFFGFFILKASTERTFRPPTFDDLFWPATAMACGNPDLLPEEGRDFDMGVAVYPLSDERMRITCTGFYRDVKNLIEWLPGAKGIWRPHNVGKALIKGIEMELSSTFYPISNLLFEIVSNYTYTRAEDLTGERNRVGKQLVRRPIYKVNLQVYVSLRKYQISTTWNYVGFRYITSANTKWIPEYTIGNCNILYQLNENVNLSLGIKNIMGRHYVDITEFPIPGRTWNTSMSFDF